MALLNYFYDEDPRDSWEPRDPFTNRPPRDVPPSPGAPVAPIVPDAPADVQPFDLGGGGKNKGMGAGAGFGMGVGMPSAGPPDFALGPVPRFNAPRFRGPTLQDALGEPGYQFRLKGGSDALERSAAARGTLRTGGTLKDILEYGQNFATQEYGNVFNRALSSFDRDYRGAHDEYAPLLAEYQTRAQTEMAKAMAQYQREWDRYQFGNLSAYQQAALAKSGGGGGGFGGLYDELDLLGPAPTPPGSGYGG